MKFDEYGLYVLTLATGIIVLGLSGKLHAEESSLSTSYYNQYGNTVIENTYNNGSVTSTYYNQYGNTVVANTYNNTSK